MMNFKKPNFLGRKFSRLFGFKVMEVLGGGLILRHEKGRPKSPLTAYCFYRFGPKVVGRFGHPKVSRFA
jgi:hypothetical protein